MGNKSYVSLALSLTSHPLPEECSAGAGVLAGGKVPLGKLMGKQRSWVLEAWLAAIARPSETSAGLSPGTWLGKWEEGMKKTTADHKVAPYALALK